MKTTNLTKRSLILAIFLLMMACQNGAKQNLEALDGSAEITGDTLQPASQDFTETKISGPLEMLLPVQYRKESTGYPKNVESKDWYEFYKDEKTGDWKIGKAKLQIAYGFDECAGEDIMIIKSEHETAVMFFTTFNNMSQNPVTILEDKPIFPQQNLPFNLNGNEYQLSALGSFIDDEGHILPISALKEMSEEEQGYLRIDDYTLSFKAPGNVSYSIVSIPQIISVTPQVIWAGDMNGDGLPDLVLNLSDFYEAIHIFLFLSDKDDLEKPLKKAADLNIVNDC